jgi:hypothetical protein
MLYGYFHQLSRTVLNCRERKLNGSVFFGEKKEGRSIHILKLDTSFFEIEFQWRIKYDISSQRRHNFFQCKTQHSDLLFFCLLSYIVNSKIFSRNVIGLYFLSLRLSRCKANTRLRGGRLITYKRCLTFTDCDAQIKIEKLYCS